MVVVCDGDAISARRSARVLQEGGFAVEVTGTASECEAAIDAGGAAAAVIAVLLPDEDGLRLTRRLRSRGVDVGIVVASALEAEERALEAGADAFLRKPVAAGDLLAAVRRLIGEEST